MVAEWFTSVLVSSFAVVYSYYSSAQATFIIIVDSLLETVSCWTDLPGKVERQYLLSLKVSRCCLLTFQSLNVVPYRCLAIIFIKNMTYWTLQFSIKMSQNFTFVGVSVLLNRPTFNFNFYQFNCFINCYKPFPCQLHHVCIDIYIHCLNVNNQNKDHMCS